MEEAEEQMTKPDLEKISGYNPSPLSRKTTRPVKSPRSKNRLLNKA